MPADIGLRLRKRRDGSLALTDAASSVSSPDRCFPSEHVFTPTVLVDLAAAGALALIGTTIEVQLCNAKARYEIVDRRANGEIVAQLADSTLTDAPPIDEAKAVDVARQTRAARIAELARTAGLDAATAEKVLISQGAITADEPTATQPKEGEV